MSVTVRSGVVFGAAASGSGQELLCDIYTPDEAAPTFPSLADGRRVGVLLIHGGVCRQPRAVRSVRRRSAYFVWIIASAMHFRKMVLSGV